MQPATFPNSDENQSNPIYVSPAELGRRLGVSKSTITRWHQAKLITPKFAVGRCLRFDVSAVEKELAEASA